jgi:mono/diheme cytochrome c family protein
MAKFILGVLFAFLIIFIGGYAYISLGLAPVATASAPMPFETTIAKMALNKAIAKGIAKDLPQGVPLTATEDNFAAGARLYRINCAVCHGLPGQAEPAIGKGEFPKPPQLFQHKGVTDDPPGETYWKIANGIRLSGMPAFKQSLSQEQMWQMSLMLANADKLSPAVHATLEAPLPR